MANTISNDAIAKILKREYERNLTRAYKVLPFANREFEGDIRNLGDTVRIPTISIWDWKENANPYGPANKADLTIWDLSLTVTKYYDIMVQLSDKDISLLWKDLQTTQRVAQLMREKAQTIQEDYFISKLLEVQNKVKTPKALTGENIYTEILRIGVELDKKDVPEDARVLFVSPLIAWIILSCKELQGFETWYKKQSEGEIWRLGGFTIIKTNALKTANEKKLIAYQGKAGAFVEKINSLKVKEAVDGNYTNIIWGLFFDAGVLGENAKRICIYEGA